METTDLTNHVIEWSIFMDYSVHAERKPTKIPCWLSTHTRESNKQQI